MEALEAATCGGGACDRCRGTLVIVEAVAGQFHSATWNGEPLDEHELRVRETVRECPKCGWRIDPDEATDIKVGWGLI